MDLTQRALPGSILHRAACPCGQAERQRAGRELGTVTLATAHFGFGSAQALTAPSLAVFFRAFKSDSRWLPLMPGF